MRKCSGLMMALLITAMVVTGTLQGCGGSSSSDGGSIYGTSSSGTSTTTPVVTSVTGAGGQTSLTSGQTCTINGSHFGSTRTARGNSKVTFMPTSDGGSSVDVTSYSIWSDTSIICTVPSLTTGTTYVVVVTVVSAFSTSSSSTTSSPGNTITAGSAFSITSIYPRAINVGGTVTITGTGFGSSQGSGYVLFGEPIGGTTQYTAASWNNTAIVCTVPSGVSPATSVSVRVFLSATTYTGASSITVVGATSPLISSISPSTVTVGSTSALTISGANLGSTAGTAYFVNGSTSAGPITPSSWSATQAVVNIPSTVSASAGSLYVTLHTSTSAQTNSYAITVGSISGRIYALFVGINAYSAPISALRYCVNDVTGMQTSLTSSSLWSGATITTLTDSQATKSGIQNAINSIASQAGASDMFFFYYSGHGSSGNGHTYICPVDCNGYASTFISDTEMYSLVNAVNTSAAKVLIFDSCFSGGFVGKDSSITARYTPLLDKTSDSQGRGFAKTLESISSLVFLGACTGSQYSSESSAIQHGFFTYYLIQGLGSGTTIGPADSGGNGSITAEEAFGYASPLTINANSDQTPQMQDNYSGQALIIKQ